MYKSILQEFKAIFHLALPLILNLLAYVAMQFVDSVMLGKLGTLALAAAALGNVAFIIVLVGCMGTLTAVGTLSAQAFGDKKDAEVKAISQQGIWLAIFLSVPAMFLIWHADVFLYAINQPSSVVAGAKLFLQGLTWSFLPDLCFIALREFVTAISKPRIIIIIAITAIPANAILNYWFMYGGLGLPAMHILGVGLATSVVSWLMCITLAIYVGLHKSIYRYSVFRLGLPKLPYLRRLCRLGYPVGVSFIVEEFLFVMTALLIGYFGVAALAAHQIAIQCMYVFVMIPLGLAQGTAIRVSQLLGAGDHRAAFRSAYVSIGSGLIIALVAACLLWGVPWFFVQLFITPSAKNYPVFILAIKILAIIAVFHIVDAGQLITNGALRGHQDTLIPMLLGVFSFWLTGIGSGYIFGFVLNYGVLGLWWGLALGITVSAILLQWRLLTHK